MDPNDGDFFLKDQKKKTCVAQDGMCGSGWILMMEIFFLKDLFLKSLWIRTDPNDEEFVRQKETAQTLNPTHYTLHPKPYILNPTPCTRNPDGSQG